MSASEHRFAVGDHVICNPTEVPPRFHRVVYVIEKFGPVNAMTRPVAGGKGLRINPSALLPAPTDPDALPITSSPPLLCKGTVVTVASPRWTGGPGLFVVLSDDGERTSIVLLGGQEHRYWPKLPRSWITPVDRDQLLAFLAGFPGR